MLVVDLKSYEVLNTREILARFDREVEYETLVSDLALTDAEGWKSGLPAERLLALQRLFGYTRKTSEWSCNRWRSMVKTLSGPWATTRPLRRSRARHARSTTIYASASPRSPIHP